MSTLSTSRRTLIETAPAWVGVVFFVFIFACSEAEAPGEARQNSEPETAAAASEPPGTGAESPSPAEKRRRARRAEDLSKRIWWNQEAVIEKLGLEEAQRRRMDELFHAFVERDERLRERQKELVETFYTRLESGDWEGAERAINALAADRAEQVKDQPLMKIEVIELLTPEQLSRFQAEYPNLFRQPWLRRTAMGSPRGQKGRGVIRERQAAPSGEQ